MLTRKLTICECGNGREIYYVPLHSQPEASTVPAAGRWHDQVAAIVRLREEIRRSDIILVKEHPYQYLVRGEIPEDCRLEIMKNVRPRGYYEKICSIGNTYLLPINMKTEDVFKTFSPTVVGIAGSTTIEAYIKGMKTHQLTGTLYPYEQFLRDQMEYSSKGEWERIEEFCAYMRKYSVVRYGGIGYLKEVIHSDAFLDADVYFNSDEESAVVWSKQLGCSIEGVCKKQN